MSDKSCSLCCSLCDKLLAPKEGIRLSSCLRHSKATVVEVLYTHMGIQISDSSNTSMLHVCKQCHAGLSQLYSREKKAAEARTQLYNSWPVKRAGSTLTPCSKKKRRPTSPLEENKMKAVTALVIGAGARGRGYADYGRDFPDRLKIVGVADPRKFCRERIQKEHEVPAEKLFTDWAEAAAEEKFADCVIIATPDALHKAPAVAFAKKGYHILLEKPMAVTPEDCKEIVATCKDSQVMLAVCHVLRYAPQARKIKEIIDSGVIGDVVNIQLLEPVGFWHFAHSYVRGNWRSEAESTFSLLSKSCHDIDLLLYWMGDRKCQSLSSFGSLHHFNKKNKPVGAGSRCLDCAVEENCQWSAKKIYMTGHTGFPVNRVVDVVDIENLTEALYTGPYGRCVYDCDNDVMDNQVVNMQFDSGATVSFTMIAFTDKVCVRQIRVFGTKGELTCDMDEMIVNHVDFLSGMTDKIRPDEKQDCAQSRLHGHGGADFYAMDSFIDAVGMDDPSKILTGPDDALTSHLLCFYAEKARKEGRIINPQTEDG